MDEMLNLQPVCKKNKRLIRDAVEVRPSPIHGYGVFADQIIFPGEIIEECPIIFVGNDNIFNFHSYNWDENLWFMPLGYGAIYNHSMEPNANYVIDKENRLLKIMAKKVIYRGDEIFIHYGNNWFKRRNLQDATDHSPKPQTPQPEIKTKISWSRIIRIVTLSLILVLAYLFTSTSSKPCVQSSPVLSSTSQQLNTNNLESSPKGK